MNKIKSIYLAMCNRIYSVGKLEFEKRIVESNINMVTIGPESVFHQGSSVSNFSKDRSKIKIGQNSHIYGNLTVYSYAGEIILGDNCSLSEYSRIVAAKRIKIGNRVMIAHNVNILDNISHPLNASERHRDFIEHYSIGMQPHDLKAEEILIEDDVWIGFNTSIMKGVKVGRGAIIGANSIVTKDIDAWTVNVGNPIRVVRRMQHIEV
jgi:acetyltransferase-like isoleucine patch superfamily enzyme